MPVGEDVGALSADLLERWALAPCDVLHLTLVAATTYNEMLTWWNRADGE